MWVKYTFLGMQPDRLSPIRTRRSTRLSFSRRLQAKGNFGRQITASILFDNKFGARVAAIKNHGRKKEIRDQCGDELGSHGNRHGGSLFFKPLHR